MSQAQDFISGTRSPGPVPGQVDTIMTGGTNQPGSSKFKANVMLQSSTRRLGDTPEPTTVTEVAEGGDTSTTAVVQPQVDHNDVAGGRGIPRLNGGMPDITVDGKATLRAGIPPQSNDDIAGGRGVPGFAGAEKTETFANLDGSNDPANGASNDDIAGGRGVPSINA